MEDYKGKLDRAGIAVSFLCLVHCVLLPAFLTTLSLAGMEVIHNVVLEVLTLAAAVITGGLAMWKGHQKHGKSFISLFFLAGIGMLLAGNFVSVASWENYLKLAGALIVISAHIGNFKFSRRGCILQTEKI